MVKFYTPGYPSPQRSWNLGLGHVDTVVVDELTGKEDFTKYREIDDYVVRWRPGKKWHAIPTHLITNDRGLEFVKSDRIVGVLPGLVLSQNAVSKLALLLEDGGNILPLDMVNSDEVFFLWWIPVLLDSVDLARCEMTGRRVQRIDKHAFFDQRIKGVTAFRPHHSEAYNPYGQRKIFVSEVFKQAWEEAELTGIEFREAYETKPKWKIF